MPKKKIILPEEPVFEVPKGQVNINRDRQSHDNEIILNDPQDDEAADDV